MMTRSRDRRTETLGLVATTAATFLTSFTGSATNIALPTLGAHFRLDAVQLSWIALAYMLATAALVLPMGRLGDLYGRKRIFLGGLAVFSAASALCGFASTFGLLLAARVLQGVGASMLFATSMAITTSIFPVSRRGAALGINTASVYLGLSVGPTLGGWLTHACGWQSVFLVCAPAGLVVLLGAGALLPGEWKDAEGESFDLAGSVVLGTSLVVMLLGLTWITRPIGPLLVGTALALFLVLAWVEGRARHPVLNLSLFQGNRAFTFSNLAALINYMATFAVGFLLSLYLQDLRGLTPQAAGMILLTQPIVKAVFSPLTGRLSDRVEPTLLASLGMGLTTLGLAALAMLGARTPLGFVVGALVALGLGFALFSSPNTNAVMRSLPSRWLGIGSATLSTMRIVGQIMSLGIATVLFAVQLGDARIEASTQTAFMGSIRLSFQIFAGLCLVGIFFSASRGRVLEEKGNPV